MSTQPKPFITPEQYLEIEEKAERKSEYYNGEMFLMAGNVEDHVVITANLSALLWQQFRDRACNVYSSETRVLIPTTGLYTYPDVVAVCGEKKWADQKRMTLLNPTVIIEVLSESTEAYDRGEKLWHYRHIPSLREYILVSQIVARIDQYLLRENEWVLRTYDAIDATLELPSVNCSLPLREIYLKTAVLPA